MLMILKQLKQKDIILLVVALIGGVLVSVLATKYLFNNKASQNTQVDVVPAIHTDFQLPPSSHFNAQAIDPTQIINISPNSSQQPFNTSQ